MGYTITINSENKQALAFVDYAKKLGFKVTKEEEEDKKTSEKPEKKLSRKEKEKAIEEISKSINKAMTKRMFAHFNMPYPEEK